LQTAVALVETKNRDLLFICNKNALSVELKRVTEAFRSALAECHELDALVNARLE
jgi:hypothetical protein